MTGILAMRLRPPRAFAKRLPWRIALRLALALAAIAAGAPAIAQTAYPPCEPPTASEYLLMVRRPDSEAEVQLYEALPETVGAAVCDYLGEPVVRLSGFPTLAIAEAWSEFLRDRLGQSAFIVGPSPAGAAATAGGGFAPRPLGLGYAVLVDYFNRPQLADTLREATGDRVGVAAYGQRPYLLAGFEADAAAANRLLRQLSDRGFSSLLVDGRQVMLLRPDAASVGGDSGP